MRLAGIWREGVLPEAGGAAEQAAWTVAAIEIVLATWNRMRLARQPKDGKE